VISAIGRVMLGKEHQVRLALACLLARGHLLIEDLPGVGKTTLAEALARSFSLAFKRASFTSDLLPADLTGLNVFDQASLRFHFQPGPLFCQVLLADEINRASPRTQSALLEAMAAGRVSVDGTSHPLPEPFLVIATQNGIDQGGTNALPESQLDRFLMRLSLGFPERQAERTLLEGQALGPEAIERLHTPADLLAWQRQAAGQHCSPALLDYVLDLLALHLTHFNLQGMELRCGVAQPAFAGWATPPPIRSNSAAPNAAKACSCVSGPGKPRPPATWRRATTGCR